MPVLRLARQLWRRLTSMRTALILLFLLALASVPGSLLPQRPLNPSKVQSYLSTHGAWGRFLNSVGGFDVFGSFWFAAIYLLLWISLIGCIIPRIRVYARALRTKPLKAPRNLSRLPESGQFTSTLEPAAAAALVRAELRPRWRAVVRTEDGESESGRPVTVAAEKGYTREAGNLLFHISLLVALVLIAGGRFLSYEGSVVSVEGGVGFCNPGIYDTFRAGSGVNVSKISQFCVNLDSFTATYRSDGSPSQFRAVVTYHHGADGPSKQDAITVNHPLRLEGDRIYLINHGFAPVITVTRPGKVPVPFADAYLAQDTFFTSEGVNKLLGPAGKNQDIGLEGIFAPTPQDVGGVVSSTSPQANNPELALIAYVGDTQLSNGLPQSVYTLDKTKMKRVASKNLFIGQSMTLPDGTLVTFSGYKQWASLQVSHDPTQGFLLVAAVTMVAGLLGSLVVRRRRVWLRITPIAAATSAESDQAATEPGLVPHADSGTGPPARSLIEVGGLARSDTGNFATEFALLVSSLRSTLNTETTDAARTRTAVGASAGKD
jgi:cytochrome c biogenesis protein